MPKGGIHIKKFVAMVTCLAMCLLSIGMPASAKSQSIKEMFESAAHSPQTRAFSPVRASVEIIGEDGNEYSVDVFEYTPSTISNNLRQIRTFVFSTEPEYVTSRAGNTQSNTAWDDSISVYGYITVAYNSRPAGIDGRNTEYLLTNVSGGWEISDHSVSLSNRRVAYTCQYIMDISQITSQKPTSNTFSYNTGYSVYVPDDGVSSVLGANSSVDLAHGTSSKWSLSVEANIFENDIGDLL